MIASKALIHNGCTTAVEAAILGTPAVAFQPVTDDTYDMILPNSLSHHACDLTDVEKTVRAIVDGALGVRDDPEVARDPGRSIVAALDGPLAADRMIDVLVKTRATSLGCPSDRDWIRRYVEGRDAPHALRTAGQADRNRHRPGHRNNVEFHRHRFPGISADELRGEDPSDSRSGSGVSKTCASSTIDELPLHALAGSCAPQPEKRAFQKRTTRSACQAKQAACQATMK